MSGMALCWPPCRCTKQKKKEEEVRVWRCRGGSWSRRRATFGCRLWWARSWQRGLKAECGREARRRGNLTAREAPLSQVRCPPAVVVFGVRGRRWQRKEPAPAGKRRVEYSRRAGGGGHNGAEGQRGVLQPQNLRRHRRSRPASLWPWKIGKNRGGGPRRREPREKGRALALRGARTGTGGG
jgi:hypothetical protein